MKLATYKDGSRDGQLVVVSRDLSTAHYASGIATRLQQVLDDWNFLSPQLEDLYQTLNHGKARHAFPFEPAQCAAPLPRACQWADGSAFINHVELVRKARGADVPESFYTDPLMYQGGSDDFLGPTDDVVCASEEFGIDFEAEVAVVTGDVAMGSSPDEALEGIRLLMLANDVSLRNLIPAELAKGFGFFQSKPATAFGPVAVTLDELGDAWDQGRVNLTLQSTWNGRKVGMCDAGLDHGGITVESRQVLLDLFELCCVHKRGAAHVVLVPPGPRCASCALAPALALSCAPSGAPGNYTP